MAGVGEISEVALNLNNLLLNMETRLKSFESKASNKEEMCTIYRVVPSVRKDDGENGASYDPKIICIGPYHRNKDPPLPTEDVKWQFLFSLINRHKDNTLDKLLKVVQSHQFQALKLYSEEVKLTPDAFVEMLVLDGCFILEFLSRIYLIEENERIFNEMWKLPFIRSDLFLLENQIPFSILEALFKATAIPKISSENSSNKWPQMTLLNLALMYITDGEMVTLPESLKNVKIHHLLHLFHISLIPNPEQPKTFSCLGLLLYLLKNCGTLISNVFIVLISLIICCFGHSSPPQVNKESQRAPRMMPSVTELQEAGIKFKKRDNAKCFLDVKFENNTMEIPRLNIQVITMSLFRNLVAFEQCCPGSGNHFTSYAALMDNLINTHLDVAVLQDRGIIENNLGSCEDVAFFFNKLCKGGYVDFEKHYLRSVFEDVRKFCSSDIQRWRAMLVHSYFSNPWATISFIAAFVLLGLTIVQTVFSILSYVHPPN
ncbi:hypothetical protein IHE45_07G015100 [Dioscorea alata]|uniref:Uncharacterized protein n=1 Tax=Dioscorea alata TaxID=55571 RepID=A0ACB7VPX3_DIOAL|nr:hypothetical protein IHE45_07G015100 [Dioscorea alata]